MAGHIRLVMPHQLFTEHVGDAKKHGIDVFVLVEHDLLFRQYHFHAQKLVLHRASMSRFAERLREETDADVHHIETSATSSSREQLATRLKQLSPDRITVFDVVDDWLGQDLTAALADADYELTADDVWESPNFLTSRADIAEQLGSGKTRMQHFYSWQRKRLDVLMDGAQPVGGKWSFDEENRKKLPKNHAVPEPVFPDRHPAVTAAIEWVAEEFPDAPGDAEGFCWPTSHDEARDGLENFLNDRFAEFGPYEDAVSSEHPFVFHSLLTAGLNIGLISPRTIYRRALTVAEKNDVPLASLEGFIRQIIGWREYMRATYHLHGRKMRTRNHLEQGRKLGKAWWTGKTGLDPVDLVIDRVNRHAYAHHIERLMVIGNAMCLLRVDPDEVYEWFMALFIDAYDWVMVPNVYGMSQFAAGEAITTKPYISGSSYLKKMTDIGPGEWREDWDALYWVFVRDHQDVFARNPRSSMMARMYDKMDAGKKSALGRRAAPWLEGSTA